MKIRISKNKSPVFVFEVCQLCRQLVLRLRVRAQAAAEVVVLAGEDLGLVLVVAHLKIFKNIIVFKALSFVANYDVSVTVYKNNNCRFKT